jgi:hypothetical protein
MKVIAEPVQIVILWERINVMYHGVRPVRNGAELMPLALVN